MARSVNNKALWVSLALATFCVSCNGVSKDRYTISIAISKTPLSSPLYVASAVGYFEQCGLDVTVKEYAGGLRSLMAMVDGHADFATGSDSLVAFNAVGNKDLAIVASFASSDHDTKILEREYSISTRPYRVGYYPDTASEYLMRMHLALSPTVENIELVAMTPEEILTAWGKEELDKAIIWEPYAFRMVKSRPNDTAVLESKGLYQLNFQLLSLTSTLAETPEMVERMIHAINLSTHFIAQNPNATQAIVKEQLKLDDDFIDWIWPDYQFKLNIGRQLLLAAQENARWFQKVSNHQQNLRVDTNQISEVSVNMVNPSFAASKQFCDRL